MKNKVFHFLCLPGLIMVSVNAHAVIVSQTCVDSYDPTSGYYSGYSCDTSTAYDLAGTMTLQASDGSPAGAFSITASMTQNITYTEDFDTASSSGETITDLIISPAGFGTYTMNRVDWLLDGGVTLGSFSESLTGSGYTLSGMTDWFINADGIVANLMTLDGDGDGKNGINLLFEGQLTIADVALTAVPVPAAVWLFGSGLLCLIGAAKRSEHSGRPT